MAKVLDLLGSIPRPPDAKAEERLEGRAEIEARGAFDGHFHGEEREKPDKVQAQRETAPDGGVGGDDGSKRGGSGERGAGSVKTRAGSAGDQEAGTEVETSTNRERCRAEATLPLRGCPKRSATDRAAELVVDGDGLNRRRGGRQSQIQAKGRELCASDDRRSDRERLGGAGLEKWREGQRERWRRDRQGRGDAFVWERWSLVGW